MPQATPACGIRELTIANARARMPWNAAPPRMQPTRDQPLADPRRGEFTRSAEASTHDSLPDTTPDKCAGDIVPHDEDKNRSCEQSCRLTKGANLRQSQRWNHGEPPIVS